MSLSSQDVLRFLNTQHCRSEVFRQISLATPRRPLASKDALYDPVTGPVTMIDDFDDYNRDISPASAVPPGPSSRILRRSPSSLRPRACTAVPACGTMYVCELPEGMWNAIGAPSATSTPTQQQFCPFTECPASDALRNTDGVCTPDGATEGAPTPKSPVFPCSPPRHVTPQQNHARPMQEELGRPNSLDESLFMLLRTPDSVAPVEDSQNSKPSSPRGQCATELLASPEAPQASARESRKALETTQAGCGGSTMSPTSLQLPVNNPSSEAAVATPVCTAGGTVTVVVWVSDDAAATATGALDSTDAAHTAGVTATFPSSFSVTPVNDVDAQRTGLTSPTSSNALAHVGIAEEDTSNAAISCSNLSSCLCFAVHHIDQVESHDTDRLTPRNRPVQVLTLQLRPGAAAYATNRGSDVFVPVEHTSSPGGNVTSTGVIDSGTAALSSHRPALGSSFSFVFHQGGITRCVAALRRHSPRPDYVSHSKRSHSSSLLPPAGARRATGVDASTTLSFSPLGRGGMSQFESSAVHGVTEGAVGFLKIAPLLIGTITGASGASLAQQPNDETHGWRQRLSAGALFRRSTPQIGGCLSHNASTLDHEEMKLISPHPSSASVALASPVSLLRQGAGSTDGSRGQRGLSQTSTPKRSKVSSRHSSFEDLTDEMTARQAGSCYTPPLPALPLDEDSAGACTTSRLTAADWERVFDIAGEAPHDTQRHGNALGNSSTHNATSTAAPPRARRLNADRWRAFRQAVYEQGGLADDSIRFEVWCYLLGAFAVGSTGPEKADVLRKEAALYTRLTSQWQSFLPEQEAHFTAYRCAKHSILKDVERTDRTHPAFSSEDSDMLRVLRELLLAHVMLDMDLGYSQGMSDVAAVALLVTLQRLPSPTCPSAASEAAAFMCYRRMLSEHMAPNFVIEERKAGAPYAAVKGLQCKLYEVQVLTRHFHPCLYAHLTTICMVDDMSFCLRWILVCFKRDLRCMADTMRFWDVLFACPYTTSYEVVVTVALLGALTTQIITHVQTYETLFRFTNALSSGTTVDEILVCARRFYENVCVPETREVRRRLRRKAAEAATRRDTGEQLPGWYAGQHSMTAAAAAHTSVVNADITDVDANYFPCVREMVQLFLETDGPL
ncbi:hypothetical protein JKF63_04380 [Porcisia hertigi]|uniref:Rab-GAP TBC domain-containing protein n=1 Tax=Porcisia hertigi TaxID=2761500 RepID=A0A836LAP9_9TRYP|nr:hypothetical protein JKF63_04380 [Porcisia hertigi]